MEVPETDPLIKRIKRLKPRLFYTKPSINRYKKIEISDDSDEMETADSNLSSTFSGYMDSPATPRLVLGRKQTYHQIKQQNQDLTMSEKITSYFNQFKNKVKNFFGAEVEQQVSIEKVMRKVQTEKYALSKSIEK